MHTPQQSQSPNNAIAAKLAGIENADRSRKNAGIDVGSGNYLLGSTCVSIEEFRCMYGNSIHKVMSTILLQTTRTTVVAWYST
jgi:hypothetical protein